MSLLKLLSSCWCNESPHGMLYVVQVDYAAVPCVYYSIGLCL